MNCIEKILKRKPSILVVGDIMLDHYIYGKVDRISPEAPVPVVRCMNESDTLGGCGNVIRNLTNIGVKTSVVTAVGNDFTGRLIITPQCCLRFARPDPRLPVHTARPDAVAPTTTLLSGRLYMAARSRMCIQSPTQPIV